MLFLSPLPQSIYCYDACWTALTGDANLWAVDLPGFGGSEGGMDKMSFAAQSALEELVAHFDLTDVHIVAPDRRDAGRDALRDAPRAPGARHPHRGRAGYPPSDDGSLVRKIVGSSFWRAMVRANGAALRLASATQVGYLHYRMSAAELSDYVRSYEGRIDQVVAYFASYPEGLKSLDSHIDTLDLPVQVFWGDMDAFLSAENARRLHARLPQSRLTIFEDCGHFCYQDKADEFTEMIRGWIAGDYRRCANAD